MEIYVLRYQKLVVFQSLRQSAASADSQSKTQFKSRQMISGTSIKRLIISFTENDLNTIKIRIPVSGGRGRSAYDEDHRGRPPGS